MTDVRVRIWVEKLTKSPSDEELRVTTEGEKRILIRMRQTLDSDEKSNVPTFRTLDRFCEQWTEHNRRGVMHNLLEDNMSISERKRLWYTVSFVASQISELMRKKKRHFHKEKSRSPRWIERSIVKSRRDLFTRVWKLRQDRSLDSKVLKISNRKHDLL